MSKRGLRIAAPQLLWCALGIYAVFAAGSASVQGTVPAGDEGEFCSGRLVRDYARPLRGLPKLHRLPISGKLPFGPDQLEVELFPLNRSDSFGDPYFGHVLLPDASKFGYVFRDQSSDSTGLHLDWVVTARMLAISRKGTAGREVARKRMRIGRVSRKYGQRIVLSALRRPGLYRFDIQFRNRFGRKLGRFKEYVRIVRARYKARLVVNDPILHRGESTAIRIDNLGTRSVTFEQGFSFGFALQRFDDLGWVEVPVPMQRRTETNRMGGIPNVYAGIPAGWSTRCIGSIQALPEFEAGLYRILKPVRIARRHGLGPPINLAAEFQVVE